MEMRSYSEIYLNEAKQHLGAATDYLVNDCGIAADRVAGDGVAVFGHGDAPFAGRMGGGTVTEVLP